MQEAQHWARVLGAFGHTVRLIALQFVKPYLQAQRNDANDAAVICEAISRPEVHFVPGKTMEQQDLQVLHRVRGRLIGFAKRLFTTLYEELCALDQRILVIQVEVN